MSRQIIFATGNNGKVATLKRHLAAHDLDIDVIQRSLDLIEPQADTAAEVAKSKAEQAYGQLKCSLVVDDSSFHIAMLGGFPGPYVKYMLTTIGIDGIMEFMKGRTDRDAYFLSTLVYIDENGETHVFDDSPYHGVITEAIDDYDDETNWGDLHKVFIPNGSDKVLARMTKEDHARVSNGRQDAYEDFVRWLKTNDTSVQSA